MYEFAPPDKRRPVLILTRPAIIPMLRQVTVASITTTMRGAPSEVAIGVNEGLKHPCVVNLHQVFTLEKNSLRHYVGMLPEEKMQQVCKALALAVGC